MKKPRLGIYAGTFDPVHSGHITFALQALEAAQLDRVYFLPERQPRGKDQVEHFGHRVAMLNRAIRPFAQLEVLELVESKFSVSKTLPHLRQQFPETELVFLFGSDIIKGLADWPDADILLGGGELIIGIRSRDSREELRVLVEAWKAQPRAVTMFDSYAPDVSSGQVREALRKRQVVKGLLKSVERYSDHHWLYVSLSD